MGGDGARFNSPKDKEELVRLDKRWRTLLEEKEVSWPLNNRSIWISCGDENTKFFQDFSRGQKMSNAIWEMKNLDGESV